MADGLSGAGHRWWWTDLFRTAQVALDKKLLLAAAGIVLMWAGWWFWSAAVASVRNPPTPPSPEAVERDPQLQKTYYGDREQYMFFHALAGPANSEAAEPWERQTGIFRVRPWNEDRGPNPFLLVTGSYRE